MTKKQSNEFQILLNSARIAGLEAVQKAQVVPMIVGEAVDLFSNKMRTDRPQYFVADGVCGFAWVKVITKMKSSWPNYNRKLNVQFANWLKAQGKVDRMARKYDDIMLPDDNAYNGGVDIWISVGDQSMQKKEAYAHAFAEVLCKAGIFAYAQSRMD